MKSHVILLNYNSIFFGRIGICNADILISKHEYPFCNSGILIMCCLVYDPFGLTQNTLQHYKLSLYRMFPSERHFRLSYFLNVETVQQTAPQLDFRLILGDELYHVPTISLH